MNKGEAPAVVDYTVNERVVGSLKGAPCREQNDESHRVVSLLQRSFDSGHGLRESIGLFANNTSEARWRKVVEDRIRKPFATKPTNVIRFGRLERFLEC